MFLLFLQVSTCIFFILILICRESGKSFESTVIIPHIDASEEDHYNQQ